MKQDISVLKNLTLLIVEDDTVVLDELFKTASILFHEVYTAKNGQEAFLLYECEKIDMIITDIKMPLLDGIHLVQKIRQKDYEIPIVVLSSYSEQNTLLQILNLGVDGYLIKPVEFYELVNVMIKASTRNSHQATQIISFKNNKLFNPLTKELFFDGKNIELGTKELALLELLIQNKNKTISKEEIISILWPLDETTDSALKGVINRLRKKIGEEHIVNIKGFGWKFSLE